MNKFKDWVLPLGWLVITIVFAIGLNSLGVHSGIAFVIWLVLFFGGMIYFEGIKFD